MEIMVDMVRWDFGMKGGEFIESECYARFFDNSTHLDLGYGTNQYVFQLICENLAKKFSKKLRKEVKMVDFVQYFQRGTMQGNIGYLRLLKIEYGVDFVKNIAVWGAEKKYSAEMYDFLKGYGLNPIKIDWQDEDTLIERQLCNVQGIKWPLLEIFKNFPRFKTFSDSKAEKKPA